MTETKKKGFLPDFRPIFLLLSSLHMLPSPWRTRVLCQQSRSRSGWLQIKSKMEFGYSTVVKNLHGLKFQFKRRKKVSAWICAAWLSLHAQLEWREYSFYTQIDLLNAMHNKILWFCESEDLEDFCSRRGGRHSKGPLDCQTVCHTLKCAKLYAWAHLKWLSTAAILAHQNNWLFLSFSIS